MYAYVIVRTDLALSDQIVQAAHASLEAGRTFFWPAQPAHLVLLSVPDQRTLVTRLNRLANQGLRWVAFNEPDRALGLTAAASEPVSGQRRRLLRNLTLWRAPPERTSNSSHNQGADRPDNA